MNKLVLRVVVMTSVDVGASIQDLFQQLAYLLTCRSQVLSCYWLRERTPQREEGRCDYCHVGEERS